MIRLELVEIVKKQFPDLDISTQEGIARFSKIVRSEVNRFGYFSNQEAEEVINFLSLYDETLAPLINHKNISIVLQGAGENITLSPLREKVSDDNILKFKEIFKDNVLNYIKQCIILNEWNNLKNLFRAYSYIINDWVKNETLRLLSLKNQELVQSLVNKEYVTFVKEHAYATDVNYFSILNTVDKFYFDEEMLQINSSIQSSKRSDTIDLSTLGKIMYALTYYISYNELVNQALITNKRQAYTILDIKDGSSRYPTKNYHNLQWIVYLALIIAIFFIIPQLFSNDTLSFLLLSVNMISFIAFIVKKMN